MGGGLVLFMFLSILTSLFKTLTVQDRLLHKHEPLGVGEEERAEAGC